DISGQKLLIDETPPFLFEQTEGNSSSHKDENLVLSQYSLNSSSFVSVMPAIILLRLSRTTLSWYRGQLCEFAYGHTVAAFRL
ncbi:hypothetical protein, partial [Enterobacter hormaechei]|uniref:hypothetical protein n=1 Tax=Enterobacter hormaechei TaxID=158836 RepID=UPI001BD4CE3F